MMATKIPVARRLGPRTRIAATAAICRPGWPSCSSPLVAWTAADNALQIHGGKGFAHEYSIGRILCDAQILSIFEKLQAQVDRPAPPLLSDARRRHIGRA